MILGLTIEVLGGGRFDAPVRVPLPVGSVLVLEGRGADVAKHCVPAVKARARPHVLVDFVRARIRVSCSCAVRTPPLHCARCLHCW